MSEDRLPYTLSEALNSPELGFELYNRDVNNDHYDHIACF